jgi:hypothetical protein
MTIDSPAGTLRRLGAGAVRFGCSLGLISAALLAPAPGAAQEAKPAAPTKAAPKPPAQRTFATPEEAAWALIAAAEQYDVPALTEILGSAGLDLVATEDSVADRNQATAFATLAREETHVVRDPKTKTAIVNVGPDDWPLPIDRSDQSGRWRFDTKAGRREILYRRIGGTSSARSVSPRVRRGPAGIRLPSTTATLNQCAQRMSAPRGTGRVGLDEPDSTWEARWARRTARHRRGLQQSEPALPWLLFRDSQEAGPAAPMELTGLHRKGRHAGVRLVAASGRICRDRGQDLHREPRRGSVP